MLPGMTHADGIRKQVQVQFGGYDHRRGAGEGTLWDMENLSSRDMPYLSTRRRRIRAKWSESIFAYANGFTAYDKMIWTTSDRRLMVDGQLVHVGMGNDGAPRYFAQLGAYVLVFPDKVYYNLRDESVGNLEETWTGSVTFSDGTIWGEPAQGCSIVIAAGFFAFREGDAVEISGCTTHTENNKTAVIREISTDRRTLTFYENTFTTGAESGTVTIARRVPDMDYICVNENRLWGCKGDTIYASKLGDPFNFNVFDGISTDSYAVDVGSDGDFTGACAYMGYPCFFKENHIYKVYGDKPANFQVMGSADLGTAKGAGRSFGIAGGVLYYLSRAGIAAYTGGVPEVMAMPFGEVRYHDAVGGSDGIRYYVSMADESGVFSLFCYDTQYRAWHREDSFRAIGFAWLDGFWGLQKDGNLWRLDGGTPGEGEILEEPFESFAEFSDFAENRPERKGSSHFELRVEISSGSLRVRVQYDSDGVWRDVKTLESNGRKRSFFLPIIPRRCDHLRIRLEGTGEWRLESLTRNLYLGSEIH